MKKRHIAFIDILGIRRILAAGLSDVAVAKLDKLTSIVEEVVPTYPGVVAHGATGAQKDQGD